MVDLDFESLSIEELTHILKEVSRIVDKRVATELGQYRKYAQKFAESVGLEVKEGTGKKIKEGKAGIGKKTAIYKHPENESIVWEGTGRKPNWLIELLKSGRNLDDFRVSEASLKEVPQSEGVEGKPGIGEEQDKTKEAKPKWRL
jgi:DNA-binding protein H-NS